MTRSAYHPQHDADGPHHWAGTLNENGDVVDVRVPHCPTHWPYELPCARCAELDYRPTEGADAAT